MSRLARGKPNELLRASCIRGKFCELAGAKAGSGLDLPELFTTGMFSLIDAVIDQPMAEVMAKLPLSKNIINAILLGIYLMGKEQPKSIQFFCGLQFAMISSRLGFPRLTRFFRTWTPKAELEKAISGLMNTRFAGLEVPFPGAALDIDNDRDFRTMGIMFDQWRAYLKGLNPP